MSLYRKVTVNGVEQLQDLAGTFGSGLPIGTMIDVKDYTVVPSGWLKCDGSTFDRTVYPELYLYLGSETLPLQYDASSLTTGTPDWYAQYGQYSTAYEVDEARLMSSTASCFPQAAEADGLMMIAMDDTSFLRVTHTDGSKVDYVFNERGDTDGKMTLPVHKGDTYVVSTTKGGAAANIQYTRVAIWYYKNYKLIKATTGLSEHQATDVYNQIINSMSNMNDYSTDEKVIGKWADGKIIYRKLFLIEATWNAASSNYVITSNIGLTSADLANFDRIVNAKLISNIANFGGEDNITVFKETVSSNLELTAYPMRIQEWAANSGYLMLEYTKVND